MTSKIVNIKTKRPKKPRKWHKISFVEKVAAHAGCSDRQVYYVLEGQRSQETPLAQRILIAAAIIEERENALLNEVKRIVKL